MVLTSFIIKGFTLFRIGLSGLSFWFRVDLVRSGLGGVSN